MGREAVSPPQPLTRYGRGTFPPGVPTVLFPGNDPCICDFLLVINLDVSPTVFEILTFKARKSLICPTHPLFDGPAQGKPVKISGRNLPCKNYGMGATIR